MNHKMNFYVVGIYYNKMSRDRLYKNTEAKYLLDLLAQNKNIEYDFRSFDIIFSMYSIKAQIEKQSMVPSQILMSENDWRRLIEWNTKKIGGDP